MKWKYEGKILHGDIIDFVCKQGYVLPLSTALSEVSVQCNRGDVRYPVCVRRGKGMRLETLLYYYLQPSLLITIASDSVPCFQ